ncbi:hypothetical protein LUZ60_007919 [Juncus effusus]|nr:hypothetical protein LUZ60_007919 [Juncus effusus]
MPYLHFGAPQLNSAFVYTYPRKPPLIKSTFEDIKSETMEARLPLMLLLSLLLFILAQGNCEKCDTSSVQIQQTNLGKDPKHGNIDMIFEVEIKNLCSCNIKSLFLHSQGFGTSIIIDPKLFRQEGDYYLVNDGQPITSQSTIKFKYSWDHYFKMNVASFESDC